MQLSEYLAILNKWIFENFSFKQFSPTNSPYPQIRTFLSKTPGSKRLLPFNKSVFPKRFSPIKSGHPQIQIITLQHGIFGFDYIGLKGHSKSNKTQIKPGLVFNKNFRKTINKLSKIFLNIYILGEGFGSLITHKFIVYNQIYIYP